MQHPDCGDVVERRAADRGRGPRRLRGCPLRVRSATAQWRRSRAGEARARARLPEPLRLMRGGQSMRPPRHGGGSTAIGAIPRHRRRAQRAFVGGEALL